MSAPRPDRFFDHPSKPPPEEHPPVPQRDLAEAIAAGDPAKVRALAPETDLATPGKDDMTLLMFAMAWAQSEQTPDRLAVVTELVRAGADAKQDVPLLGSALDLAIDSPGPGPLAALLDGGVSPDAMAAGGYVPALHRAANEDAVENMRLLLERGADVDARDSMGSPAITAALRAMQLDQVDELLERGADPGAVNRMGESFAHVLHKLMARQLPGSPALLKMTEIKDRIVKAGVEWPPADPAVERDRMRDRGEEPIVPAGALR